MNTLPPLLENDAFGGSWEAYLTALYEAFKEDFLCEPPPRFAGKPVFISKDPYLKGKEGTFWHLISKGPVGGSEEDREPDFRKCERIKWIKYILEKETNVKIWRTIEKKGRYRMKICYGEWEYIIILIETEAYYRLLTAYPLETQHAKRKIQKDYEENGVK